jgi:hypothetical protein
MALRFIGKDPNSEYSNSPSLWDDGDNYVIQGWVITDPVTLAEVGTVPAGETVLRFPKRMMQFFREAGGAGGSGF